MRSGWFIAQNRADEAQAVIELALVAALAQERLHQTELDRIARAIQELPELSGIDWDWLINRIEELRGEAPLFSDARDRIAAVLGRSALASFALTFAERLLWEGPADDARFILSDISNRLSVDPTAPESPLPGLLRARFNDPADPDDIPFHTALARADPIERRLLLFKLQAARSVLDRLGPGSYVVDVGRHIAWGMALFRADAVIQAMSGRYTCRFLAPEEALHPEEHRLVPGMVTDLRFGEHLLFGYAGRLGAPDAAALEALPSDVVVRMDLSV